MRNLHAGNVGAEDWPRLIRSVAEVSQAPLFLGGLLGISVEDMRTGLEQLCRDLSRTGVELGLVVVDYFQLMLPFGRSPAGCKEHGTTVLRGLKLLARDFDVPVLVLAELRRDLEQRHDGRPWLTDFGPSEPVEDFADVVMFLYRDEYYDPDCDDKGIAEIIVARNRGGPTDKVQQAFLERWGKFASLGPADRRS
jgi:replicative DNA helicase